MREVTLEDVLWELDASEWKYRQELAEEVAKR
jgi:hypothetical protein